MSGTIYSSLPGHNGYLVYTITAPTDGGLVIAVGDASFTSANGAYCAVWAGLDYDSYLGPAYARSPQNPDAALVRRVKAGDQFTLRVGSYDAGVVITRWLVTQDVEWGTWFDSNRFKSQEWNGQEYVITTRPWFWLEGTGATERATHTHAQVIAQSMFVSEVASAADAPAARDMVDSGRGQYAPPDAFPPRDTNIIGNGPPWPPAIGESSDTHVGYSGWDEQGPIYWTLPDGVNIDGDQFAQNSVRLDYDVTSWVCSPTTDPFYRDTWLPNLPIRLQYQENGLPSSDVDVLDDKAIEWSDGSDGAFSTNVYANASWSWNRSCHTSSPMGDGPKILHPQTLSMVVLDAGSEPLEDFSTWKTADELTTAYPILLETPAADAPSGSWSSEDYWLLEQGLAAPLTRTFVNVSDTYLSKGPLMADDVVAILGGLYNFWDLTGSGGVSLRMGATWPDQYRIGTYRYELPPLETPDLTGGPGETAMRFASGVI